MRVSHVGSFPLDYSRDNVYRAMSDLWRIGVDAPPYPQLRSFIDIYLEPLVREGIVWREDGFYYVKLDRVEDVAGIKPCVPEAVDALEAIRELGLGFKWLRAPVTGVFTLASRLYVEKDVSRGFYATLLTRKEIVEDILTRYIRSFVDYMVSLGYNIVFIDEPVLGVLVGRKRIALGYTEDYIVDVMEKVLRGLSVERGVHVCGRVSDKLFQLLLSIESINVVNLEFHDTPGNLEVLDKRMLEKYDKLIAPGIVSARKPVIEDPREIKDLLNKIIDKTGGRIDLVSGDCGFAGLKNALTDPLQSYYIAIKKLETIVNIVHSMMRIA